MTQKAIKLSGSGKWSPRKSLFIVVVGAAFGWVAALVTVYGIMRSMDGAQTLVPAATSIASESDYRALADIAPAAGGTDKPAQQKPAITDKNAMDVEGTDSDQP